MRGREQIYWRFSNQTRAEAARTWLNGQLQGRSYIAEAIPVVRQEFGEWRLFADVAIETVSEGNVVRTLVQARQDSDTFVLSGSFHQFHSCDHYDGANNCAATTTRTVKP